jgi:hypothetical protein
MRLQRLIRYMGRPPLSDGRLLYRLKKQWRDGTSKIIFQPLELMERLAALVPAPRFNYDSLQRSVGSFSGMAADYCTQRGEYGNRNRRRQNCKKECTFPPSSICVG